MAEAIAAGWRPSSSFGWIDVDRDEAKRVREMLGLLKAPEAIDPHGILPLQIALSDRLFPGMSTQHTRARYIMFSAWHAQRLAQSSSRRGPLEQLRMDELALMRSLLDSDDNAGVFGKRAREKTKTFPTMVYWSLLQTWGLIPRDLTPSDLQSSAAGTQRRRARLQLSDDAGAWSTTSGLFSPEFPLEPEGFPAADQTLDLTSEEVTYLKDRVAAACPQSFLQVVLSDPTLADGWMPWTMDPAAGGQDLIDAQSFSELIHPTRLMYTKLLTRDARLKGNHFEDLEMAIEGDFAAWREECDDRIDDLRQWVSTRLASLLIAPDVRLSGVRRDFISASLQIVANDPDTCLESEELGQRVRLVERSVKRGNARLSGGEPFQRWMKQPTRLASQRLDYRWGNVRQLVADLERAG